MEIMLITIEYEVFKWYHALSDRDYIIHYNVWDMKIVPVPFRSWLCQSKYSVSY